MKILLVEDDSVLRQNIAALLKNEGYAVEECADGDTAEYLILQKSSDVIILDRMLPGQDGVTVTERVRKAGIDTPILMLTALDTIGDKITGLDAGADDYIVKPFDMGELLARLRIWSRRAVPLEDTASLCYGDLCYQTATRLLKGPGGEEVLPKRLGQFAELLLRSTPQPLSRPVIFNRIWGPDADVNDNIIDTYIHLLRQKLALLKSKVQVTTARGMGYTFSYEQNKE